MPERHSGGKAGIKKVVQSSKFKVEGVRIVKLTIAYDGSAYLGWQVQPHGPTVQSVLEEVLGRVTGTRTHLAASGRTDAGVHALGQVASFATAAAIPPANFVKAINRLLPPDIRVLAAEDAPEDFHARFKATAKTYGYRIYRGQVCPPFVWRYVHHFPYPLDEAAMMEAAPRFAGTHDFSSLASSEGGAQQEQKKDRSKVRTIFNSCLLRQGDELVYNVRGSGFLHHMVRNIVGTLIEVGKGTLSPADVPAILAARRRSAAGPTLPAKGLWLISVEY